MFTQMINQLKETEKQFKELNAEKVKREQVLSAVMKKVGSVEISIEDLFKSDIDKIQMVVDKSNPERLIINYDENFIPLNQSQQTKTEE